MFVNLLVDVLEVITSLTLRGTLAVTGALTAVAATFSGLVTANQGVKLSATAASGVTVLLMDSAGKALLATGTTVPSDAGTIYAKGCLFIDTDVGTGTTGLYCNKGTAASCVFTAVTQA